MSTNIKNSIPYRDSEATPTGADVQLDRDAANHRNPQAQSGVQLDRDADLYTHVAIKLHPDQAARPGPQGYEARRAECIADCRLVIDGQMTKKALKEKYQGEYQSHRAMLQREKSLGREVAPEWHDFARFLMSVGPRPGPEFTVDRLDNSDPAYAPGKVDWRNKKDQANNRSSTIFLTIDGQTQPVSVWETISGTPADTIRKRKRERWGDREAVYGKAAQPANASPAKLPWPAQWEDAFQRASTGECRFLWLEALIESELRRLRELIDPYDQERWEEGDPHAPADFPVDPPHIPAARERREKWAKYWRKLMGIREQRSDRAFWNGKNNRALQDQRRAAYGARRRASQESERSLDGFDYPPGCEDADTDD